MVGFETDVAYNRDLLDFVGVQAGDFLASGAEQFFSEGQLDEEEGVIADVFGARYTDGDQETPIDGSGVLFQVTFVAREGGEAFVGVQDVVLSDGDGAVIPSERDLAVVHVFDVAYDINLDFVVDIQDLVLVAQDFGATHAQSIRTDLNRDARVNILDLAVVAAHFGENIGASAAPARLPGTAHASSISAWLRELRAVRDGSPTHARAVVVLEQLLSIVAPERTALLPAYPNPFNPETWVPFDLRDEAQVTVSIYDARGLRVRRLDLGSLPPGTYQTRDRAAYWDGTAETGEAIASGVYFVELTAGDYRNVRRIVMMK